ncbi:hypothetical protein XIS1_1680152 [Xenorhabdus innexi]|uniref:Uncharacterized protein n=1 Tax=Xenorhabdus innexi TaxID=290109 RepID=A0A1N6MVM4_9GAMM|nr:hypothetical protein XIS1_1680152 [Xenorhabdus innexi]
MYTDELMIFFGNLIDSWNKKILFSSHLNNDIQIKRFKLKILYYFFENKVAMIKCKY